MWPLKKKKVLSFEEFQAQKSGTPAPEVPEQGSGEILSFEEFKAKKQPEQTPQPLGFEEFRGQSKAQPINSIKPAETPKTQLKPVDQIEHENTDSLVGRMKNGIEFIKENLGEGLETAGFQPTKPWDEMSIVEKGKATLKELPVEVARQSTNSALGFSSASSGIAGFFGADGAQDFSASIQKFRTDHEKGIKPKSYEEGDNIFQNPSLLTNPEYISRTITEQIPNLATMMLTRGFGEGALELGGAFNERMLKAKEDGREADGTDRIYAGTIGLINGYLGKIGFDKVFANNPVLKESVSKSINAGVTKALNAIAATGTEMGTEYIQEVIPEIATKIVYDEGGNWEEVLAQANKQGLAAASAAGVVSAPISAMTYGAGGEGTTPAVNEQKPFSGVTPSDKTEQLISTLEDGGDIEEVVAGMSKKELDQVSTALQTASQTEGVTPEQMATLQEFSDIVNERLQGRVDSMSSVAEALVSGETPAENLPLSDREEVKKHIEQVKAAAAPEEQALIDEMLSQFSTDRLDGVDKASELDNESSPFFDIQDEDSVAKTFADLSAPIQEEISTLSSKKRDYLAKKQAATTPEEKRSLQTMIDAIDEEKRSYQTDLSILEEQAGSKNLVLLQNTIDKIKAIDPSFSVANAVDNRWTTADYKKHLATLKPVTKKEEKKETVKSSKPEAKESQKSEKKPVTKKTDQVKFVTKKEEKADLDTLLREIDKPKEGLQGKQLSEEELIELSNVFENVSNPENQEWRGVVYDRKNGEKDIVLGKIEGNFVVAEVDRKGNVTGRVRIHATPISREGMFKTEIFGKIPMSSLKLGSGTVDGVVKEEPANDTDILIDFVPFSVKKTGSKRRISKEEKDARNAMQDAVAASLFDEKIWSRIMKKTGTSSITDFEDYAVLEELKNRLDAGKKIDFEMVRAAYEALARYGIPVADLTLANMPESEIKVEKKKEITETKTFKEWFGDSKVVDEEGKPLVVYHGSNNRFETFDKGRVGDRDSGWFGKGFYFTLSKGEAQYYGGEIVSAYLRIENPFIFSDYEDQENRGLSYSQTHYLASLGKAVPEVQELITLDIADSYDSESYSTTMKRVSLKEYTDLVEQSDIDYKLQEFDTGRGIETRIYLKDFSGREISKTFYNKIKVSDELLKYVLFDVAYQTEADVDSLYGVERLVAEFGDVFTDSLKKQGYDGTMQSKEGDEYVVFDPNQVKSVENKGTFSKTDNNINYSVSRGTKQDQLLNSSEAFVRGLDNVKVELLSRVHNEDITPRDYQEMSHFLDMVSPLVQNMAVSVAEQTDADTADGMYDWISDTVSLFRNIGDSEQLKQTFYHEVGHHVSRFIPKEMLEELYTKFNMEKEAFLDKNPQFRNAEKLQHGEKMAYYANHNPDENYKFFNLDEYFAEMIRTKSTKAIQEELGTKPDRFVMQVIAYAKQLINAMKEVVAIFRGKDVSDRIFELVTSGENLEEVNSFGLVSAIEKGSRTYKDMLESRRSILYAAYNRNIDKLSPMEAIAFEKAFRRSVDIDSLHEAVDVLIRNGIKTTAFYRSAAKVRKLAEQKYKGAFVDPKLADEYMRIIDSQAELLVQERGFLEEVKMMEEFGDILDDDQEAQLDSFIELIKNTRGKNKEILQSGDFEQIEKVMAEKGFAADEAGNMFYSFQEEDYNQVLDKFRAIIMRRNPQILVGKKAVVNLGMKKMKETALENLKSGKSQFSEQFNGYQKELESILKESAMQFTKEDLDFIDASKKLKNELHTLRREKEKQRLMRAGSTLGKSVQRAQFATRLKDFRDRKNKVRFAKEFFGLSDSQFRKIGGNTPVQYLTEEQFNNFMKRIEGAAANESERSFYIKTIYKTIKEKELRKWQNLQKAWKMPTIENMTIDQLKEFSAAMDSAKAKDTFLTQRQIETVDNTELKGIKTLNEAKERLAERMGVPVEQVSNLSAGELDRFRYDTALAEQNVFYQILVDDTNREFLLGETRFLEDKKQINKLIRAARKSRPRSVGDYFVPTDTRIFEYLESENKAEKAKDMTEAELKAAEYIRERYEEVRNYLLEKKMLDKFRENYITHVRKTFLETWKDSGFLKAIKGVFDEYQEQEATFNILDGDTGEILPMEKFFQFSLARTGGIDPTQNVARAFLAYMQTFEKKRAFDAIIPKMEIYTDALMAEKRTKGGLLFDRSLKNLVREWINNKKGRRNSLGGIVRQGGKLDLALRFGNTFVTLRDLGFSIPTGLASHLGEQAMNFVQMGAKMFAKGSLRMATPKGRAMLKKYQNFTGENPWSHLVEAADHAGDVVSKSMFVLFRNSQWLANQQYLLGSLTEAEWKAGELSKERLAVLKREMGRWRVVEGAESVYGSTSVGKVGSKYKGWAVPILRTTADNIVKVAKNKKLLRSKEGQELIRSSLVIAVALLAGMALIGDEDKREKDKTLLEKIRDKAIRDALSSLQIFDMSFWLGTPRLADYLYDFAVAIKQVVVIEEYDGEKVIGERYKTSKKGEYEKGDFKGVNAIKRSMTPTAVKQFIPPSE